MHIPTKFKTVSGKKSIFIPMEKPYPILHLLPPVIFDKPVEKSYENLLSAPVKSGKLNFHPKLSLKEKIFISEFFGKPRTNPNP
jgi:hypothetical protein